MSMRKKAVSYSDNLNKQNKFPYRKKYNFNVNNDHVVNDVLAFIRDETISLNNY